MKLAYDFHMHTVYSDGKSTVEENVKAAIRQGLDIIAITDHGPGHMFFGIKERDILELREEVDRLNKKYNEITVLLGIEANILGVDGKIDASQLILDNIDVLLAGYHFGSMPNRKLKDSKVHLYNFLGLKFDRFRKRTKSDNTRGLINAMKNYDIDVLTHPGDKGEVDIEEVAKVAAETNTLLEISEHHKQLTVEQIIKTKKYDVNYIVSSDAHLSTKIGKYDKALKRIKESKLDITRVVNIIE